MCILKRIGLFFLWLLIPSVITVSVNTFSPFTLGGLLTVLLYAPFLYLIKKTLSGDFDGKYSKTNQKVSKLAHSDDVSEPHLNEPAGTQQGVVSEPDSEGTSKESPAPEAEPETPPGFSSEEVPETPPAPTSPSASDAFPKYCDNCGTECEPWVKFCPVCGCKSFSVWVKKSIQVADDPELLRKADAKGKKNKFKKRLPLIGLSVLCAALVFVSSALYIDLRGALKENEALKEKNEETSMRKLQYYNLYFNTLSYKDFLTEKIGFIVDGSNQYHTFDCEVFRSAESFWAHNKEYCEYLGYTPHSCWDK